MHHHNGCNCHSCRSEEDLMRSINSNCNHRDENGNSVLIPVDGDTTGLVQCPICGIKFHLMTGDTQSLMNRLQSLIANLK